MNSFNNQRELKKKDERELKIRTRVLGFEETNGVDSISIIIG